MALLQKQLTRLPTPTTTRLLASSAALTSICFAALIAAIAFQVPWLFAVFAALLLMSYTTLVSVCTIAVLESQMSPLPPRKLYNDNRN